MRAAKVYRPQHDWRSSKGDDDGYLHDVDVVAGGQSSRELSRFPGVHSTEGQLGFPVGSDVKPGDRLLLDGEWYLLSGPKEWGYPNSLTGTPAKYFWLTASTATV